MRASTGKPKDLAHNNFLKLELIVPTLRVGMQYEPLCGSGRRSVPHWVTTQSVGTIRGRYFSPNPKDDQRIFPRACEKNLFHPDYRWHRRSILLSSIYLR